MVVIHLWILSIEYILKVGDSVNILQLQGVEKNYITNSIFNNITFSVHLGQKIGLVGPNGAGKSTLLKCIACIEPVDSGSISFSKDVTYGYLDQNSIIDLSKTLEEIMLEVFQDIIELRENIRNLEMQISNESDITKVEKLLQDYQEKQTLYDTKNGYSIESRMKGIIIGLGFNENDLKRVASTFSGGERTRIMLAKLLVKNPDLLLLDEPTNHLDLPSIEWLEAYLKNYKGAVIVISHDEYFLDAIIDTVFDLENQTLNVYSMPFVKYKEEKLLLRESQHKKYLEQQNKIAKELNYISRNKAGVNSRQARGREKKLSKQILIQDVSRQQSLKINTYDVSETARFVLSINNLDVVVDEKILAKSIEFDIQSHEKVAIIGKNGIGKSSLLKTIIKGIQESNKHIKLGNRVRPVYFDQHQLLLNDNMTILEQTLASCDIKISEAKSLLARYLFTNDDLEQSISLLSGGERVRLSLMIQLYNEPNFLIMDEPTNHLDAVSKKLVIDFLKEFSGAILVVSHDRQLLNEVSSRTLEFTENGIMSYLGNYDYYLEKKLQENLLKSEEKKQKIISSIVPKRKSTTVSKSKLKNEIEKIEEKLDALEYSIAELNKKLQLSDVDYSDLAAQIEDANKELNYELELWQEKSELLEELLESGT